jgi:curved DNA-binding protein CbpA
LGWKQQTENGVLKSEMDKIDYAANPHDILGTTPTSSVDEIKKAFREKVNITHPDKGGSKEEFCQIVHAYKLLTDEEYRYKDKLNEEPIIIKVNISLEQALFGSTIEHHITRKIIEVSHDKQDDPHTFRTDSFINTIVTKIPPNTLTSPIEFTFKQMHFGHGTTRDVIIKCYVKEHERYKFHANNCLLVEEVIPLVTALRGGKIEVQTLFGIKTLRIPAGTKLGDELKLINKKQKRLGVLIIKIKDIKFPDLADLKTKLEWKELDINWEKEEELDHLQDEKTYEEFEQLIKSKEWGYGFRFFKCGVCGTEWQEKANDCTSLKPMFCTGCGEAIKPFKYELHLEWDKFTD